MHFTLISTVSLGFSSFAAVTYATDVHLASFTTVYGQYTAICKDKLMNGCTVLGPATTTTSTMTSPNAVTISKDGCLAACYDNSGTTADGCHVSCKAGLKTTVPLPEPTSSHPSERSYTTDNCTTLTWDNQPGVGADIQCHGGKYKRPFPDQTQTDSNGCIWKCHYLDPGLECEGNCPSAKLADVTHNHGNVSHL